MLTREYLEKSLALYEEAGVEIEVELRRLALRALDTEADAYKWKTIRDLVKRANEARRDCDDEVLCAIADLLREEARSW